MATVELLCSVLRSLIEVTESLCLSVEKEELASLSDMLDRREELLEQQSELIKTWKSTVAAEGDYRHGLFRLRPLVEHLEQLDKKNVTLFTEKKREFAEKLKQAQNQKRLLAYSR